MEHLFNTVILWATHLLEAFGVAVVLKGGLVAFFGVLTRRSVRLNFAEDMATALEFKLAGEILRTVTVRGWEELLLVGALILLRAALTLLIHWEIQNERKAETNPADFVQTSEK